MTWRNGMRAGTWMHNPVTGEVGAMRVPPEETGDQRMEGDLWLQPGAAVLGEHTHEALVEVFEVMEGTVAFRLDGAERRAEPGEAVEVPVGASHDWWNAGDVPARVRFSVESADPAVPMAGRFLMMIETSWGLAAAGKTNAKGLPGPLWLAGLAHEYRDVMRLVRPPAAVQTALFGPLAALGRRLGRDPLDPGLHGERCPASIPAPDDETLAALVHAVAPAGATR